MNILTGIRLLSLLRRMRKRESWTRQQIHARQIDLFRRLREYAYANSPFYRQFHKGLTDRPLRELPVLTKAVMMEQFDDLVTDRAIHLNEAEAHLKTLREDELFLGRYRVNATSGSTGRQGIYLFNDMEWLTAFASFVRAYEWSGREPGQVRRPKTASIVSPVPWHISRRMAVSFGVGRLPALYLSAGDPVEKLVRELNSYQPDILACYASIARILANEQISGRLHVSPYHIFTGAEVLTPETRRRIGEAWRSGKLFDQYGATEGGNMASECVLHEGLHLFEDLVIFEVADRENRPVPPGVYGDKLLITVLFNRTQPLIRYELSDSMRLASGDCPCGRPFSRIMDIRGRMEEMLSFPAIVGGEVTVNPVVFDQVLDAVSAGEWQIVQDAKGLNVLLSGTPEGFDDKRLGNALSKALSDKGAVAPPVTVRHVPAVARVATGKAVLIRSINDTS